MVTPEQQELLHQIDSINRECLECLSVFNDSAVEDERSESLALNLLNKIDERQKLLDVLIADTAFVERAYLEQQLELTYSLKVKAKKAMAKLQALLHSGKQGQRQINVYKSIDANR